MMSVVSGVSLSLLSLPDEGGSSSSLLELDLGLIRWSIAALGLDCCNIGQWRDLVDVGDSSAIGASILMTFLDIVVLGLGSIETLDIMLGKGTISTHLLHEANHGLATLGVEGGVGAGFDAAESRDTVGHWVLANAIIYGISEISDKPHSIAKLNPHGLIVDIAPGSCELLTSVACSCNIVIEEGYLPLLLLCEGKLMVITNDLNFVWSLVGADIGDVEHIDS